MITMNKWTSLISLVILIAGCGDAKHATSTSTNPVMQGKIYTYSDGSANQYRITKDSIEYFPVKPAQSSTGTYDGGDPVKKQMAPELFQQFEQLVKDAGADTNEHTSERGKGTAMISVYDGTSSSSFILRMGSARVREIENVLAKMKSR
jgi:hypothetical protein